MHSNVSIFISCLGSNDVISSYLRGSIFASGCIKYCYPPKKFRACQQTCYWLHNFAHVVSPDWFVCFTYSISFRFLLHQVRQINVVICVQLAWLFNIIYIISNFVCIVWGALANGDIENVGRTIKAQCLVAASKQGRCDWLHEKGFAGFHDTQHQRNKNLWQIHSVLI